MSRDLTTGMVTQVTAAARRPVILYAGQFVDSLGDDAWLRLWTGIGTLSWGGNSYVGAGSLIGISPIQETSDVQATGFTCSLSGQPSENIAIAIGRCRQGRPGYVWLGFLDANGAIVADPYLLRRGRLDTPIIPSDDGRTCTISVQYEDILTDLKRARDFRYTGENQKIDYPADVGFDYVEDLIDAVDVWKPAGPGAGVNAGAVAAAAMSNFF